MHTAGVHVISLDQARRRRRGLPPTPPCPSCGRVEGWLEIRHPAALVTACRACGHVVRTSRDGALPLAAPDD